MRNNLQTGVNFMLQRSLDFNIYVDNIALQSRKYMSGVSFSGLICTTAHQNTKANKANLASNFFCTGGSASLVVVRSKKKVGGYFSAPGYLCVLAG